MSCSTATSGRPPIRASYMLGNLPRLEQRWRGLDGTPEAAVAVLEGFPG